MGHGLLRARAGCVRGGEGGGSGVVAAKGSAMQCKRGRNRLLHSGRAGELGRRGALLVAGLVRRRVVEADHLPPPVGLRSGGAITTVKHMRRHHPRHRRHPRRSRHQRARPGVLDGAANNAATVSDVPRSPRRHRSAQKSRTAHRRRAGGSATPPGTWARAARPAASASPALAAAAPPPGSCGARRAPPRAPRRGRAAAAAAARRAAPGGTPACSGVRTAREQVSRQQIGPRQAREERVV